MVGSSLGALDRMQISSHAMLAGHFSWKRGSDVTMRATRLLKGVIAECLIWKKMADCAGRVPSFDLNPMERTSEMKQC